MVVGGKLRAVVVALLMVVMAFTVVTSSAQAGDNRAEPAQAPVGPWLDEQVWKEETDASKALTEVIEGLADIFMFDIRSAADKERALAAPTIEAFFVTGLFDELSMNPVEQNQTAGHPRNPFVIRGVREAMQFLIDRDFISRDIYGGFATPYKTPWHPKSADYGRNIVALLKLEDKYAFNPGEGKSKMFAALQAAGWSINPADNKWHDPEGRLVTIKILRRTQDERLQLGAYYGNILSGLNFNVELIGVTNAAIPYGEPPNELLWHIYTAGWIATSLTAWDDGQIEFFGACGIGEVYCTPAGEFYDPPDELEDIASTLSNLQYGTLQERADLIARGTEITMSESLRVFIDARTAPFTRNLRMSGVIWDLFGGPTHPWGIKAASVPSVGGVRSAKVLNFQMFVDGWNPWVFPGWLYDGIQRDQFIDPAMAPHPHTGRWIDYRTIATVDTRGPTGKLDIPTDAVIFDVATNQWAQVGTGKQATSKVTQDFNFGKWHHGVDITMDDVLYMWSNLYRRAQGDISQVPGLRNSASLLTKSYVTNILKGLRVVDADTLEVYVDAYHFDPQEIAAFGTDFPSAPWEVQEIAAKLLLDQKAANTDADAKPLGRIWLDLTKGDSLPLLAQALTDYRTGGHIPPGMATGTGGQSITAAEATARWDALNTWVGARGHYWPSNGPFYLDSVNVGLRQSVMKAFRTGYPFKADYWNALTVVAIPSVNFAAAPPVVFAGTPAIFDYTVTVGPLPTDDVTATWFLRDSSTGEFLSQEAPDRLGTGSYRIEVPGSQTDQLLLGNFEVIAVVQGNAAAVPTIRRISFLILPSTTWFEALLDARATLIEDDVDDLSGNIGQIQTDLSSLSTSTSGLVALVTAMAILAVIAVVISVVSVVLVMRRGRAPAMPKESPPEGGMGET